MSGANGPGRSQRANKEKKSQSTSKQSKVKGINKAYTETEIKNMLGTQSSRKHRITRIGTHVFSLGRMILARREFRVRMFFLVGMH